MRRSGGPVVVPAEARPLPQRAYYDWIRRGLALSSTAGDSWSGGVSGRRWVRQDLALGLEAWVVDAPRPGNYRVHHVGAFVQQLL